MPTPLWLPLSHCSRPAEGECLQLRISLFLFLSPTSPSFSALLSCQASPPNFQHTDSSLMGRGGERWWDASVLLHVHMCKLGVTCACLVFIFNVFNRLAALVSVYLFRDKERRNGKNFMDIWGIWLDRENQENGRVGKEWCTAVRWYHTVNMREHAYSRWESKWITWEKIIQRAHLFIHLPVHVVLLDHMAEVSRHCSKTRTFWFFFFPKQNPVVVKYALPKTRNII